jgi:hypothetical protein
VRSSSHLADFSEHVWRLYRQLPIPGETFGSWWEIAQINHDQSDFQIFQGNHSALECGALEGHVRSIFDIHTFHHFFKSCQIQHRLPGSTITFDVKLTFN